MTTSNIEAHTDNEVLKAPIIVLGSARSGTTFLTKCLSQATEVVSLIEPRLVWKYGNDQLSDVLERKHARPEVVHHIRSTFARLAVEAGKTRVLEKSPSNALRPEFVHAVFPDARFIHIIRDPLDSVLGIQEYWIQHAHGVSNIAKGRVKQRLREVGFRRLWKYRKEIVRRLMPQWAKGVVGQNLWGPRLPGMDQMVRELDILDICCLQWRMCVERSVMYGRTLPANQYMEIPIEDLDPPKMKAVVDFCELQDAQPVIDLFTSKYNPNRARYRQDTCDPATLDRIRKWCEPTTHFLGRYHLKDAS